MSTPNKAERITFWQHAYARASFVEARINCKWLLETDPPPNSNFRRAVSIAVVTLYSRPFKQRKAVRLSENSVPREFRESHDEIIEIRDKSIAHRDLDAPVAEWGFISQVRIEVVSCQWTINTISPFLTNEKARELLPLLDALITKTTAVASAFINKYVLNMRLSDG